MFVKTVRTVRLRYAFTQIVMVRSHFHCRNTVSKYWYFSETTRSFQLASHPISDNASNQDTASKQHHSRIEITTKNMIDHMLSEQLIFFIVFIHVIPWTWSISKCCPNSERIPSWLSNSHCGERRSHQHLMHPISAVELFPAIWRLFYIESVPGCIFSTQTRSAGISSKINCCGMTCWKRNQNVSRHLAAFFSCDQAALWMVFSVRLSVRLSVCHTFLTMFPSSYHHEIFRSYHIGPG